MSFLLKPNVLIDIKTSDSLLYYQPQPLTDLQLCGIVTAVVNWARGLQELQLL